MKKSALIAACIAALSAELSFAQYPEMRSLTRDDPLFVQLQEDIELSYRASRERQAPELPPLSILPTARSPRTIFFP
jgi:hypothetical protein